MTTVQSPIIVLGLVTGLALLGAGPASAAIINVACSESDLRAKMNTANNTDTLVIPDNCVIKNSSNEAEHDNVEGDFDFTDSTNAGADEITIQGAGPGRSVIDGNGLDRVFFVANRTLNLVGLTVRNGDATANSGSENAGGGALVQNATLTATNVVFVNNRGNNGGGIH
ncbi:MAG: hypothetical protein ACREMB_26560, partial [Candidatus Rokuibacteriota bacterium]